MLLWRILIGIPIIAAVSLLCWLDASCTIPGTWLMPFYLVATYFLCSEILELLNGAGLHPRHSTVYIGTFWVMIMCWLSCYKTMPHIQEEGWDVAAKACLLTLIAMAAGVIIAFLGEMARFKSPGGNTINLAGAVFAVTYVGLLSCFMIMLRIAYGIGAVLSLVIVTKLCDVGAYIIGRLFGRHKLVPGLSPGKTIEGAVGGIAFAILGAWLTIDVILPYVLERKTDTSFLGLIVFGVAVGLTGGLGDLAESLIKRDVGCKDSGRIVPGFGGFLDIFDSLLLAAPVAFGLWAFGLIR